MPRLQARARQPPVLQLAHRDLGLLRVFVEWLGWLCVGRGGFLCVCWLVVLVGCGCVCVWVGAYNIYTNVHLCMHTFRATTGTQEETHKDTHALTHTDSQRETHMCDTHLEGDDAAVDGGGAAVVPHGRLARLVGNVLVGLSLLL